MSSREDIPADERLPAVETVRGQALDAGIQAGKESDFSISEDRLNDISLRPMFYTTKTYYVLTIILALIVAWGAACWGYQIVMGMGVTDLRHPVFWGLYISAFVFWVGVSHSGTMVSSILRLSKANWRRPILRGAEAMTVFSLLVAGLFPVIHVGRLWRIYYMFPLPNQRELWVNFRSPLAWDMAAIFVYLTSAFIFLFVGLLPDIALARDYCPAKNWRKGYLKFLALGWRGSHRQWIVYEKVSLYLAIFILMIAPSVHTIVSWDFAMSITPNWHTSIFGPYFVVGAIYSGIAGVITLMVTLRWIFNLDEIIRVTHLTNLSKVLLLMSIMWGYFYFTEFITSWYGNNPTETAIWRWQTDRFGPMLFTMLGINIFSIAALAFDSVRKSPGKLFVIGILVNVAMFIERYLIVVPVLTHRDNPFTWTDYIPSFVESSIAVAAMAWFLLLYALFVKILPIVTVSDIREGNALSCDMAFGNRHIRVHGDAEE